MFTPSKPDSCYNNIFLHYDNVAAWGSNPESKFWKIGEKFRITRSGNTIQYQRNFRTSKFTTFYTSTLPLNTSGSVSASLDGCRVTTDLYVAFSIVGGAIKNIKIINPQNTLLPGNGFVSSSNISDQLNEHLNNINGPYGYPSWKQIRTGENPVARFQKSNNIISIGPDKPYVSKQELQRQQRINTELGVTSVSLKGEQIATTFVEPPVTFKYLPLESALVTGMDGRPTPPTPLVSRLQHTFCNNLYYFANTSSLLSDSFDLSHLYRGHPSYVNPAEGDKQMQDVFYNQYSQNTTTAANFKEIIYSEIIYPREVNTGLNKTRSRVNYEEDAPLSGSFAIPDYGSNGIDRNSLKRRSFWSNKW